MALKKGYRSVSLVETVGELKNILSNYKDSDKLVNHIQLEKNKCKISELHVYENVFEENEVVFTSEPLEELYGYYPNGEKLKSK